MDPVSCIVHRVPFITQRFALFAPASTRVCPVTHCVSSRRGIHFSSPQAQAPLEQFLRNSTSIDERPRSQLSYLKADIHSDWRHPQYGFTAQEASRVISIYVPPIATENDINALLDRAGLLRHFSRHYNLETAKPTDLCYIKVADVDRVDSAVAALSRFTLLGRSLWPKKFELKKASLATLHVLHSGWLPSPSSDLTSRVVRPPMTAPPNLLAPMMKEQWIVFKHLEILNPDLRSKADTARKAVKFDLARNFYTSFHHCDVLGITAPYKHVNQGWCCRILFGNPKDAREAAASWRKTYEKKRQGMANVYRGGPDIHKKLWKYRQSLPETTPTERIPDLLEMEYRELRFGGSNADHQRRLDYPTPESAVGLEKNAVTST